MADSVQIGRFELLQLPTVVSIKASNWYRIHNHSYGATQFNPSPASARFTPFASGALNVVPSLYASNTDRGAISETLLRDVPIPSAGTSLFHDRVFRKDLVLSTLRMPNLELINLTSTGLKASGLFGQEVFSAQRSLYPETQSLAQHLFEKIPKAHGILWTSVQDNQSKAIEKWLRNSEQFV